MNQILNIAGYKFITLQDLSDLQMRWLHGAKAHQLKGTILVSPEGVNLSLAGLPSNISNFLALFRADKRFLDIKFRESYSSFQPFHHIKVKIKKEIITLRQQGICPEKNRAPAIMPAELKRWYDEKKDMIVLDTRNTYEYSFGSFQNAINLHLLDFADFPQQLHKVAKDKAVVMFCTGGIRCEKAALVMLEHGFSEVYQLEGGILNYFAEVGNQYFEGECFVFDQRVAVNSTLHTTGSRQCRVCQGPVYSEEQILPAFLIHTSCSSCVNHLT